MDNHGVAATAQAVAFAFERLCFLENAPRSMVLAYSNGQPPNVTSDKGVARTAEGWNAHEQMAHEHFTYLKQQLARSDPTIATDRRGRYGLGQRLQPGPTGRKAPCCPARASAGISATEARSTISSASPRGPAVASG